MRAKPSFLTIIVAGLLVLACTHAMAITPPKWSEDLPCSSREMSVMSWSKAPVSDNRVELVIKHNSVYGEYINRYEFEADGLTITSFVPVVATITGITEEETKSLLPGLGWESHFQVFCLSDLNNVPFKD